MNKSLRIGILIDSLEVPAWMHQTVLRIAQLQTVNFLILIVNTSLSNNGAHSSHKGNSQLFYELFNKVDEKIFVRSDNALEKKDLAGNSLCPEIVKVQSRMHKGTVEIDAHDIERIKSYQLDILIQLGAGKLNGDILNAAHFGIWYYIHSGDCTNTAEPVGYWETVLNIPETGAALISAREQDESEILQQCAYFTYPFSPARNRNALFWSASTFLPRQLEAFSRLGEKGYYARAPGRAGDFRSSQTYSFPSNLEATQQYWQMFFRGLGEIKRRALYMPTWYLMFTLGNDHQFNLTDPQRIIPPKDRYWADPHVVYTGGKYSIFIEEYIYLAKKGRISVMTMGQDGTYSEPVCILEKEYHLSYPFVFEWQGKYYMLPESAQNRSIDLYECIEFPHRWKLRTQLMKNIRAVDTTLFFDQGVWWLFTAVAENDACIMPAELYLYYSKDLFSGEWTSHPCNPIVADIKKARPAGRIFRQAGKIIRPSQYISKMYGYGFDLNEITTLSETAYAEEVVASVRPHWGNQALATHTFCREGQLTIIDAFYYRRKLG